MPTSLDPRQAIRQARRDPDLVVLEGLHPLKHALRFGAEVMRVVITNPDKVEALVNALAPGTPGLPPANADVVCAELFKELAPQAIPTGVLSIARRPKVNVEALLNDPQPAPIVLLEEPRDLGNVGACVRVASAAEASGVLTTGFHDPWDPAALRGSAGLHFAIPVARVERYPLDSDRPLLAIDPDGEEVRPDQLPARAILAFGGERHGLSQDTLGRADALVRLPMREGVSSLNLATSVAALLYSWRLCSTAQPRPGQ
jgi:TrmH family RNA methyltransferase